ncbi:lectin-like [Tachysurus vachellii]|nr:lectin-like [Tachysurus vachellii]
MIYSQDNKISWRDAQEYCRWMYTDLVDIQNEAHQKAVLSLISTDYMWIGLFSDNWKWSDEATSFFRYWGAWKPLSLFNISNCVVMQMNDNGMWDDSLCDRKLPFVCYKVTTPKKKQVVKIKVRSQQMGNLNDPSMKANILKKIEEMLKRKRMFNYTIKWREKDGVVFHQESDNVQRKKKSDEL